MSDSYSLSGFEKHRRVNTGSLMSGSLSELRWSARQPGGEASVRGHVDVQHGSLRGGRGHGGGRSVLSDPPGQD